LQQVRLEVVSGEQQWTFGSQDMDCSFNTDHVLDAAMNVIKDGSLEEKYAQLQNLKTNPVKLTTELTVSDDKLSAKAQQIAQSLYIEPKNASFAGFSPAAQGEDKFQYNAESVGRSVDANQLLTSMKDQLAKNPNGAVVEVVVSDVQPDVTVNDLKGDIALIGSFTTTMSNDKNREDNIALACETVTLKGVVMPGQTFSFNETTGERTRDKGYKEAGVITGGNKLDVGLAGGVCQVSSTLFNAVGMADMEIVKRTRHSFKIGYMDAGLDAAVNYPTLDLVFKNSKDTPVYIRMYSDESKHTVTAEIYGKPLPDGKICKLLSVLHSTIDPGPTVYKEDPSIKPGMQKEDIAKHTGYKTTTYRVYYHANGKEIERVKLFSDTYPAIAQVILVAPGELPGATPAPGNSSAPGVPVIGA
jgi:vancomycin resistance protein YoaR